MPPHLTSLPVREDCVSARSVKSRVDSSTRLHDPGRLEYLGTGRVGSSHALAKSGRVGPPRFGSGRPGLLKPQSSSWTSALFWLSISCLLH